MFYSLVATHEIPTEKKAYEVIAKALRFPIYDDVEKIIGEKIWPFALRFGGAGLQANSEEWFDISIRPNYERDDSYVISVVFRNANKRKTRRFAETYEEKILETVKLFDR